MRGNAIENPKPGWEPVMLTRRRRLCILVIVSAIAAFGAEVFFQFAVPLEHYYLAKAAGMWCSGAAGVGRAVEKRDLGFCNPKVWGGRREVTYEFNDDGYRGPRHARIPMAGVKRVICIGDSITMGQDVELDQSYCALLQTMLNDEPEKGRVESFGMAQWGRSSWQGLSWLKMRVLDFHPDIVVIAYGMNDGTDLKFTEDRIRDADLYGPVSPRFYHRAGWFRGLDLIGDALRLAVKKRRMRAEEGLAQKLALDTAREGFGRATGGPSPRVPPEEYRSNLEAMIDVCRAQSVEPVLLGFSDDDRYRQAMRDVATLRDVRYLDGRAIMMAAIPSVRDGLIAPELLGFYQSLLGKEPFDVPGNEYLYVTTDGAHPNAIGHRLIAEALSKLIADEILTRPTK